MSDKTDSITTKKTTGRRKVSSPPPAEPPVEAQVEAPTAVTMKKPTGPVPTHRALYNIHTEADGYVGPGVAVTCTKEEAERLTGLAAVEALK